MNGSSKCVDDRGTQQQQKFRIITRIVAVKESKKTYVKIKGGCISFDISPIKSWIPLPLSISEYLS